MRTTAFICLLAILIHSCSVDNNANKQLQAKGSAIYGGCLRLSQSDNFQTLYPYEIVERNSNFIANHIFDGLVKLNTLSLLPEPCLAEKWEIDGSGKKYTFHLKKGAFFMDDECFPEGKGREIKAADFKYSFELLCTKNIHNLNFTCTFKDRVLGANEFYHQQATSLEGVKVIDDYTLEVTLIRPCGVFLSILSDPACAVMAKEAIALYGKNIRSAGSGAFSIDLNRTTKEKIVLTRNPNYHGYDKLGNRLPFLDSILVYIIPVKENEVTYFKKGELDIISSLPTNFIKAFVEEQIRDFENKPVKYILDNSPEMITHYYCFNTHHPPFNNSKVRQAFNYAIDRNRIIDHVLKGQAYGPAIHGINPPAFDKEGYFIRNIKGFEFDPKLARKLLAEAGYPDGKNFPLTKINLSSGGGINSSVVIEIQKQLRENLGISVDFDVVSFAKVMDDIKRGRFDIANDAWVADFPSPENFLELFYGAHLPSDSTLPSPINTSRYNNAEFDALFEKGRNAAGKDSANYYFMEAEKLAVKDAPLLFLWYDGDYRLTRARVKNAHNNPMLYRLFNETYIKDEPDNTAFKHKDSVAH